MTGIWENFPTLCADIISNLPFSVTVVGWGEEARLCAECAYDIIKPMLIPWKVSGDIMFINGRRTSTQIVILGANGKIKEVVIVTGFEKGIKLHLGIQHAMLERIKDVTFVIGTGSVFHVCEGFDRIPAGGELPSILPRNNRAPFFPREFKDIDIVVFDTVFTGNSSTRRVHHGFKLKDPFVSVTTSRAHIVDPKSGEFSKGIRTRFEKSFSEDIKELISPTM